MTATDSGTLRWRVKQTPSARTASSQPQRATAAVAAQERRTAFRVKNAAAFEDPFEDGHAVRQAQAEEPVEEQPMRLNPPGFDELQPPADPMPEPQIDPGVEEELPRQQTPRPMPFRAPPMRQPLPPAEENPLPEPRMPGSRPFARYNDRDCGVDGQDCEDHRLRIRSDVLVDKDDLIDISPPLSLPTDTDDQRSRTEQNFARIPSREWRDRANRVVAVGKLMEVAYNHAYIEDASGQTIKVPLRTLGDDEQCFLAGWWNVPSECVLGDEIHRGRNFVPSTMTWTASALCHKPLYFEDVQLERYGHTAGPFAQPVLSGAHFFLNIAFLPYKMGINPPNECQYALGYYRPGSCAPWMVPPVPLSVRGAATQAAAVGIIYPLIP